MRELQRIFALIFIMTVQNLVLALMLIAQRWWVFFFVVWWILAGVFWLRFRRL